MKRNEVSKLNEGARFIGEIEFKDRLIVDGFFRGTITSEDGMLSIGEKGRAEGNIEVGILEIKGEFEGEAKVKTRTIILKPAYFKGKIVTPLIFIEEGARFEGTCEMPRNQETE